MKRNIIVEKEIFTTNTVDSHTGELLSEQTMENRTVREQQIHSIKPELFFNVFYEARQFEKMLHLSRTELVTLLACAAASQPYSKDMLERYQYPGNVIVANAQFRQWVSKFSGLAVSSVNDALSSLKKKRFLIREPSSKGTYYLQPELLFKGYSLLRARLLKGLT